MCFALLIAFSGYLYLLGRFRSDRRHAEEFQAALKAEIAERARAEATAREREVFNFALFQHNPLETVVVDSEGKVVAIIMANSR